MPGQDRTGPEGKGPQTGRKLGGCGSDKEPEQLSRGFGRGRRCGQGLPSCL